MGSPCRGLGAILAQPGHSPTNREDHHCCWWTKKPWPRESKSLLPRSHSKEAADGLQTAPLAPRFVLVLDVLAERGEAEGFRNTMCLAAGGAGQA